MAGKEENFEGFGDSFFGDGGTIPETSAAEEYGGFDGFDGLDGFGPEGSTPAHAVVSDFLEKEQQRQAHKEAHVAAAQDPVIGEVGYQDKSTGSCEPHFEPAAAAGGCGGSVADYASEAYIDPNKPPPEPPLPALAEADDAMRDDSVQLVWPPQTGDVFILQW